MAGVTASPMAATVPTTTPSATAAQTFRANFVIGLILADEARAYPYESVAAAVVVNDYLGDVPVMIWAANNSFYAYVRRVGEQTLTFRHENGELMDEETGSRWQVARGLATAGMLRGEGLQPVPSLSAFDWAWFGFFLTPTCTTLRRCHE